MAVHNRLIMYANATISPSARVAGFAAVGKADSATGIGDGKHYAVSGGKYRQPSQRFVEIGGVERGAFK
jgi:hypothetical protein